MEDFIAICKERTTEAMESFLHDLSFVPADELTWRPTPTAKSALEIAAHRAGYSGGFAAGPNAVQVLLDPSRDAP